MYLHNVKIYNSSYKYNKVPNMDSMMLTYFWLRFISMPLFTMCVVTHTQTASIAVSDPVGSSPCALYWYVLCRTVCMNNTKERIVHVQRKKVSKWCQKCHLVIITMWANCILGVLCFLVSGCVPNSDHSNELPGFISCEKFLNDLNNWYNLKKKCIYGISSVMLPASHVLTQSETLWSAYMALNSVCLSELVLSIFKCW
jgi:hypothetical protein